MVTEPVYHIFARGMPVPVELTPGGTRGAQIPSLPRPLMTAMLGLMVAAYRLFGSRIRVMGRPLLLLITVGAKSGKRRETLLGWFPDGDNGWLVVASYAGAAKHPAWYVNLARNPDQVWVEIGNRKLKVRPESLSGAEREEAWRRIVALSPGYGRYQDQTDREIPVVRLTPVDTPSP